MIERLLGRKLYSHEHVHHMDWNKLNNCPCNLVVLPMQFNPRSAIQDPYTGQFMSLEQYYKRYPSMDAREVPF